jgi:3-deoxy-D-manno-octulosonate 8-phosphate phosphatase (KDO 8-P phosphatase)
MPHAASPDKSVKLDAPAAKAEAKSEPRPAKKLRAATKKGEPDSERLASLTGLVLDCDGVLTDGGLYYDGTGARLLRFDAKDGFGLALLCRAGIPVGVLSGRPTPIAERRLKELGVGHFLGQSGDKGEGLVAICAAMGLSPKDVAFVGDDMPDLAAFARAGLKVAVADAAPEVLADADWITTAPGGRGAVREICTAILQARGVWQRLLNRVRGLPGQKPQQSRKPQNPLKPTPDRPKSERSRADKPRIVHRTADKSKPPRT